MRERTFRLILKTTIWGGGGILILWVMTVVLRPKWYQDGLWEPVTQIHDGFYAMDHNSMDVVFVGSSQVFVDINPLLLWHDYGISSYDMTSSAQRIWISKYYVQEILKYQSPEVIALEVGSALLDEPNDEERNRKALDYMRLSREKLMAIKESIVGSDGESFVSYIFPIIRYHKRWSELNRDDFQYFVAEKNFFKKGFAPRYTVEPHDTDEWLNHGTETEFPPRNREYFDDIVKICNDNHVSLLLFKSPSPRWSMGEHCEIEDFAEKNSLIFLDYNLLTEEIGLENTDFSDANHLNISGANKLTNHIGNFLKENYSLRDYRGDITWINDYKLFAEYDAKMREDADFN